MRGSQSVENMRAALMDLLGKGGRKFNEFDRAYAAKLDQGIFRNRPYLNTLGATPLSEIYGTMHGETVKEKLLGRLIENGAVASNIAARYALPAGGVTLAGKGLYDLIGMLQAEDQENF